MRSAISISALLTRLPLVLVLLIVASTLRSQEVLPISLEKVLELSGANNLTIKEFQARQELASSIHAKSKEWWLPEIYGGLQSHQLGGAVMNGNGNFFLDVKRSNLWLGLGLNANWDFADGLYKSRSANLSSEASMFYTQAEKNKALLQSISSYYDLVNAQLTLVAYKLLVSQSEVIVEQLEVQVAAGLRYQSELLLARSNKNHLMVQSLNAELKYVEASASLVQQLNLESSIKLVSVDSALLPLDADPEIEPDVKTALSNRPELKASELEIKSLQIEKNTITKGLALPTLSVGTNGSYYGRLSGPVNPMDPIGYPSTNRFYPTGLLNASLLWSIPLGSIVYKGDSKKYNSLIQLKEIEQEQIKATINAEVSSSLQRFNLAQEQSRIAKESVQLSAEALKQSIQRQQIGTAMPFEVFQAQQFYLQAQIDYLESVTRFNKSIFELKVAQGEEL